MYKLLKTLQKTDGTNDKIAILRANDSELLKRFFFLTYDKLTNYGISIIPEATKHLGGLTLNDAFNLLEDNLVTRKVTGGGATVLLKHILESVSEEDAYVVKRVIKRDADCGVNKGIIDKIWSGLLSEIPQMLASPNTEKNLKNIVYPAYADLKADGARCFCTIKDGIIKLNSRNANEYENLTDLLESIKALGLDNVVLDGELIYVRKSLLDMLSDDEEDAEEVLAKRQEGNGIVNKSLEGTITDAEQRGIIYQVWDIIPYDVYYGLKKSTETYKTRRENLNKALKDAKENIQIIETTVVNSLAEAKLVYRKYIKLGLEGIILKNFNSVWEDKRSKYQVKFKEEFTIDLRIIGYKEHKKHKHKLGSFILESEDKKILVNVGSGLKDKPFNKVKGVKIPIPLNERDELDRERIMADINSYMNLIVEVITNGPTDSKQRKDGKFSLFIPRIKRFRNDKSVANNFEDVFGEFK